jgi:hypothetical protein
MSSLIDAIAGRGDLAHLALAAWALAASLLVLELLRQQRRLALDLKDANRRFDSFVRELARFNRRLG